MIDMMQDKYGDYRELCTEYYNYFMSGHQCYNHAVRTVCAVAPGKCHLNYFIDVDCCGARVMA